MLRALLALALLVRPALACRCDFGPVRRLASKPEEARTALLGKSEKGVFRVESSWTKFTGALPLSADSKCGLRPALGKRLILLSIRPLSAFEEGKASPTVCDSLLLEPAAAAEAVRRLAATTDAGNHFGYSPSWGWCRGDADCVLSPGVCGGTDSVNKAFLAVHDAWRKRTAPAVNCIAPDAPAKTAAACVESFCLARD